MLDEAVDILNKILDEYRKKSYDELLQMAHKNWVLTDEIPGNTGRGYQVDLRCFYDDKRLGTIRMRGAVYAVKTTPRWWEFWKKVDTPITTDSFLVEPSRNPLRGS